MRPAISVGFFFVLSGFVLMYSYDGRKVETKKFWIHRFFRLYPLLLIGFLIGAIPYLLAAKDLTFVELISSAIANLLVYNAWLPQLAGGWNDPSWSRCNYC